MYIVTGANGFIGSAMIWELNQKGISNAVCVDSVSPEERPTLLKGAQYSLFLHTNQLMDYLTKLDRPETVDGVIHLGACSSTTEMDTEFLKKNNTLYTQGLFEWCRQNKILFIYASSAATYGAGELGFSDQTDPEQLVPLNPYGFSKVAFDRWVLREGQNPTPWYGLKFFNVFGPNEFCKGPMASVAYKAYQQIVESEELGLFKSYNSKYADGEQLRDFVYVKDVTRWIWELICKRPPSGIYNMGFGKARSWLDLARSVFLALEKPLKIRWLEMPANIKDQYQYFTEADMNRWSQAGLTPPQWNLESAIADYVKNYLIPNKNIFAAKIES